MQKDADDLGQMPMFTFSEKGVKVKFELIIPSLECSRQITKFFKKYPKSSSARLLDLEYSESVINYAIRCQGKVHRFRIKRLPSAIRPEMTKFEYDDEKITILLTKVTNEPWSNYADTDYETIHLVKN